MRSKWFIPVLAPALVLAACGSSSKAKTEGTTTTAAEAKTPPVVQIVGTGDKDHWAFQLPASGIPGGVVTLQLKNDSPTDSHDFQLVTVDGGQTKDEILKIIDDDNAPPPTWLHGVGGVGETAPGKTTEATLNLKPGHYFYFCTDDTQGKKHADNGMFGELDVKGDTGAAMPGATAHVQAYEYAFKTDGLKSGDNTVLFENTGKELHMALIVPISSGKTLDDVKKAFASQDQNAQPPVDFEKAQSTEVIDPGRSLVTTWHLDAGKYALLCFMTDHAGGPPHFTKGMLQEVDIS